MSDFWDDDIPDKKQEESESDLEDDWDVDEDEVAAKKAAKEAAKKAEADKEAERVRKLEERRAAEKAAEEERIRKLNEKKTQEQLEEELEAQRYAEANDFLGGDVTKDIKNLKVSVPATPEDDDPDSMMNMNGGGPQFESKSNNIQISEPVVKREKDLYNFTPNCKPACDDYAKMLAARMFELKNDKTVAKNFNYLVESCVKEIANGMPMENWELVKTLGKSLSAIGNSKQQEHKKKTTKKKKSNTKPGLSGANKAADPFGGDAENFDDFDDFM